MIKWSTHYCGGCASTQTFVYDKHDKRIIICMKCKYKLYLAED